MSLFFWELAQVGNIFMFIVMRAQIKMMCVWQNEMYILIILQDAHKYKPIPCCYTYDITISKWKIHNGDNDSFSKTLLNVRSQSTSFIADMDSQHLHSQGGFYNLSFLNKYRFWEHISRKQLTQTPLRMSMLRY